MVAKFDSQIKGNQNFHFLSSLTISIGYLLTCNFAVAANPSLPSGLKKSATGTKCYSKMNEAPPMVQQMLKGLLEKGEPVYRQDGSGGGKKVLYGHHIVLKKSKAQIAEVKKRPKNEQDLLPDAQCIDNLATCKRGVSTEPTRIYVAKKSTSFQMAVRNQVSEKMEYFKMSVCTDEAKPLPVTLKFNYNPCFASFLGACMKSVDWSFKTSINLEGSNFTVSTSVVENQRPGRKPVPYSLAKIDPKEFIPAAPARTIASESAKPPTAEPAAE